MTWARSTGFVAANLLLLSVGVAQPPPPPLPPVPAPVENPITEGKRVLGKVLFWDEQLSSDNTMACATCHSPGRGGADGRRVRTVGFDGVLNTADDTFGSPGVIQADALTNYQPSAVFGLGAQVTGRNSMPFLTTAYSPVGFWDGRASGTFRDPITNQVLIQAGGALESQSMGPPASSVEMGHIGRNWAQIAGKIAGARPLAFATTLQADVAAALGASPTYAQLFTAAFGDSQVTPARIAFALATYERTLYPNDTAWDRFNAGQASALTPGQQAGLNAFNASNCNLCHIPPQFTGNGFRNIGLRPPQEDTGLQQTSGNPNDRGRFKVPSLRNVGLRSSLMHNGMFTNLTDVIRFYARAPGAAPQFPDNQDPLIAQVNVPAQVAPALQDFLTNALTDARVANQTFPFDRLSLWSDRASDRVALLTGGVAGSGGRVPGMIAATPPGVGNNEFKLGLSNVNGGVNALLRISTHPPVGGLIQPEDTVGPFLTGGSGAGNGYTTVHWPIPANGVLRGRSVYFQWQVADAGAPGGLAFSAPARATFFCGGTGCPPPCPGDMDNGSGAGILDGAIDVNDLLYYLAAYEAGGSAADLDDGSALGQPDGGVDINDLLFFLGHYEAGC